MPNRTGESIRVWIATIADANETLLDWLDDRERLRYRRFTLDADRTRFLVGASLLRAAIATQRGQLPSDVVLDRTCDDCGRWHGAPRLPGSAMAASVAHSGILVGVATVEAGRVGLDIERANRVGPVPATLWVEREARFKAGGRGLRYQQLPDFAPGYLAGLATDSPAGHHVSNQSGAELLALGASTLVRPSEHPGLHREPRRRTTKQRGSSP